MKNTNSIVKILRSRIAKTFFVLAVISFGFVIDPSQINAQQACVSTNQEINQAVQNLQNQGATVTCNDSNMYVTFPNGTFFNITVPNDGQVRLYAFNPATGQSIYIYINNNGNLMIQRPDGGFTNTGDGWYNNIFYPAGNPFDASIQNPIQVLFQENLPPEILALQSGWDRGPRYQPHQP